MLEDIVVGFVERTVSENQSSEKIAEAVQTLLRLEWKELDHQITLLENVPKDRAQEEDQGLARYIEQNTRATGGLDHGSLGYSVGTDDTPLTKSSKSSTSLQGLPIVDSPKEEEKNFELQDSKPVMVARNEPPPPAASVLPHQQQNEFAGMLSNLAVDEHTQVEQYIAPLTSSSSSSTQPSAIPTASSSFASKSTTSDQSASQTNNSGLSNTTTTSSSKSGDTAQNPFDEF